MKDVGVQRTKWWLNIHEFVQEYPNLTCELCIDHRIPAFRSCSFDSTQACFCVIKVHFSLGSFVHTCRPAYLSTRGVCPWDLQDDPIRWCTHPRVCMDASRLLRLWVRAVSDMVRTSTHVKAKCFDFTSVQFSVWAENRPIARDMPCELDQSWKTKCGTRSIRWTL